MIIKKESLLARPDVKEQRRQQILDAFEICVARYGVEGATLAKTAEQAGLARALIRHNIGNREDLIAALTGRFLRRSRKSTDLMIVSLPSINRSLSLIEMLFDPSFSDPQMVRVANALIAASPSDSTLAAQMREWSNSFIEAITEIIADEHPGADTDHVSAVATGITGIYSNVEALYSLGDVTALSKSSKRAALLLISTLVGTS